MVVDRLNRRNFFKLAGAALGGFTLAACSPDGSKPDNTLFAERLKADLGIAEGTTREKLVEIAKTHLFDPNWMINHDIGEYTNLRGKKISLRTNFRGELDWDQIPSVDFTVEYPVPDQVHIVQHSFGGNRLIVYGTLVTADLFKQKDVSALEVFLKEYFAVSNFPFNTIHLNFCPYYYQVSFVDDGISGLQVALTRIGPEGTLPAARTVVGFFDGREDAPARAEVLFNLHATHLDSERLGMPVDGVFRESLANEVFGFIHDQSVPINEAYSTFAGFASAVDPEVADLILGGTSHNFLVEKVTGEMKRLSEIGKK